MNAMTDAAVARPNRRREIVNLVFRFQSYFGLIIVVLLAVLISPVRNDANLFLKPNNLLNIILYASETGVLAVGMTLVILVAGIDLSVGSIMALVGCAAGVLLMQDNPVTLPIVGTIVIGHWPAIAIIILMLIIGLIHRLHQRLGIRAFQGAVLHYHAGDAQYRARFGACYFSR